jgi:putative tryptophan/tyrosine transport system substrate-binding protein
MKRREFITLLGGAVAWPVAARAPLGHPADRRPAVWSCRSYVDRVEALRSGLRELGYVEGKNSLSSTCGRKRRPVG